MAALLLAPLLLGAAGADEVWVVARELPQAFGRRPAVQDALEAAGVRYRLFDDVGDLPPLSPQARALFLCAVDYPDPVRLPRRTCAALESWVAGGGHLYAEYCQPDGGRRLFGVPTAGHPVLARHERLALTGEWPEAGPAGCLLDEHMSYALQLQPPEAGVEVARYGRHLGTYTRTEVETGYAVIVDLGREVTVASVSQRFGAGRPEYEPESVEVSLSTDGVTFHTVGSATGPFKAGVAAITADGLAARLVRIRCQKWKRSPVTDFLFMGEIEVRDPSGANVALNCPYTLAPMPDTAYGDAGGELTDGRIDGEYPDGLSVGWATRSPAAEWAGIVARPWGEGRAILASTALSDSARRHFRPSLAWSQLWRAIVTRTVPGATVPAPDPPSTPAIRIEPSQRREAYRRALDRNLLWFVRSGIMPRADGSLGVHSALALSALFGGPVEELASSYRCDCNAMTLKALWLYGDVTGDGRWHDRALRMAELLVGHQFSDPSLPRFGGFPWLDVHADASFPWDDNTRIANVLLWLWERTGDRRWLMPALRNTELARALAREDDGVIAGQWVDPVELDRIGRQSWRDRASGAGYPAFDIQRWAGAALATRDPVYRALARRVYEVHGGSVGSLGMAHAARILGTPDAARSLAGYWARYLADPDVRRYGVMRLRGPGSYEWAFENDCSINTIAGEPLTDQLYQTSWDALAAWAAYKAIGDPACREAFEGIADYLVAIQCADPDPRLDGCWMRGFDFEAWEYFGAPYDPNYGPYHAYSGWMNAIIDTALAQYLLDESPYPVGRDPDTVHRVLAEVRAER